MALPPSRKRPRIELEVMQRASRKSIPVAAQFNLTHLCNLQCVHCYRVEQEREELNTEEVMDILAQLARAGTMMLTFSGGEPFARPDLPAILERAQQLRFACKVYTNAMLIDDTAADLLFDCGVHEVHVSIYSADPAVHDSITLMPGSLARSLAGIRRLRARGVRVKLKCVIMRQNRDSYLSVLRLAEQLGAASRFDPVVTVRTDGDDVPLDARLAFRDLTEVFRQEVFAFYGKDDTVPDEFQFSENLLSSHPCSAGHNNCSISPYGDVSPCVAFPLVAGSLREQPFAAIWESSPVLRAMRGVTIRDLRKCSSCADLLHCVRCPGSAMLEDGDWRGPSKIACETAAAKRRAASRSGTGSA